MTLDPAVLEVAARVLTEKQMEVWILEATKNWGTHRIALHTNLAKSSVNDRLFAARRNLLLAGVRMDGSQNYYLEETA